MFFGWNVIVRSIPELLKIIALNVSMVCKVAVGLMSTQSPELPTICSRVTKIQNSKPAWAPQTYDPTSNEGVTEFAAHFALLKRKHKTCVRWP